MGYVLKAGAPDEDKLFLRIGMTKTWKPKVGPDSYPAIVGELEEAKTVLDVLHYEKHNVEGGYTPMVELMEPFNSTDVIGQTWEIVDAEGNVWSEYVED